jgi:hypothetical protein
VDADGIRSQDSDDDPVVAISPCRMGPKIAMRISVVGA